MTKDEMIEQLLMQVNSLTIALNSLQQSFDAQTALVANLKRAFWGQTPLRKNKLSKENIKGER